MELPKSPVQTTINLLAELRNRPDGWGTIAAQNILLNKSGNDAEQPPGWMEHHRCPKHIAQQEW
jgi:hypothetical protein